MDGRTPIVEIFPELRHIAPSLSQSSEHYRQITVINRRAQLLAIRLSPAHAPREHADASRLRLAQIARKRGARLFVRAEGDCIAAHDNEEHDGVERASIGAGLFTARDSGELPHAGTRTSAETNTQCVGHSKNEACALAEVRGVSSAVRGVRTA